MALNREDESTLKKIRSGDKEGIRILFHLYYRRLYQFAVSLLEDRYLSEDVVQEVFIHIWEKRRNLEIKTSLTSYLFAAVQNRCIHHLRKLRTRDQFRQREMMKLREAEFLAENSGDFTFSEVESADIRQVIAGVFDTLPEKTQVVFRLSRTGLMTNAEIARHLGLHIKTVEYHISRALKEFYTALKPYL